MTLRLISLSVCPFVQRAVIVLNEKEVPHETTYLADGPRPDWLHAISPRGKVPVIDLGEGVSLFESQAICEYLEEAYPEPALMPTDLVERARDRAWFAFAAEDLFRPIYQLLYTDEQAVADTAAEALTGRLRRLDDELGDRGYLSGDGEQFGMADVAVAPAFTRLAFLEQLDGWTWPEGTERVEAWAERILLRETVRTSVPDVFEADTRARMAERGALVLG